MSKIIKMSDEDYFASDALSKSFLARMDCPAKARLPYPESPAMALGSLVHCAVLEPEELDARYAVAPLVDRRTKEGKEEYAKFLAEAEGKEVVKSEDMDTALGIQRAVRMHSMAYELTADSQKEMAAFWKDGRTGEAMKGKADILGSNFIADLKTCRNASPGAFAKSCADFKYHWQAAHYMRGFDKEQFYFIAVESKPPFVVEVYQLDELSLDVGRTEIDAATDRYIEVQEYADWNAGYTDEEVSHTIGLPAWALK